MELTTMFIKTKSRKGKEISKIPTRQSFPSRFLKFVPVVIERYKKNHVAGLQEKFKFIASSDMTVSQLVSLLRRRMKLSPSQGYHLLYSKGRKAVMMSQLLGEISFEYKDSMGVVCFTFAAQNTFGCPVPCTKSIKSKFPGIEPNPFGAPEPQEDFDYAITNQETHSVLMQSIVNVLPNPSQDTNFDLMQSIISVSPNLSQDTNFDLIQSIVDVFPNPTPQFLNSPFPEYFPLSLSSSLVTHNFTQTDPDNTSHIAVEPSNPLDVLTPMQTQEWPLLQSLPLHSLVRRLNILVPLRHIHLSLLSVMLQGITDYGPLVNSLTRLVQALQNHVPSEQNLATLPNLPPPADLTVLHFLSIFFPPNQGVGPLVTLETHRSDALNLANQVLARLQEASNPLPLNGYQGQMQLSVLIQYFNQVSQHLEFQNLVSPLAELPLAIPAVVSNQDSLHSEQHPPMPEGIWLPPHAQNLNAVFNPSPSWYLNDSDSLSEEDGDLEYFCDILL